MFPIKFPTKHIFPNFYILKINRMMSFVTYLWNDPRNLHGNVITSSGGHSNFHCHCDC